MDSPDLRAVAERGAATLGPHARAEEVLEWAAHSFGDRFAVASSMGDAVLVSLAARVCPGVRVLFLDTGYHFAETLGTRDAVAARYPIRLVEVRPERTVAEQDDAEGAGLFARDPDRCCRLRKVLPLSRALAGYQAWATGVRRADSPTRADTPLVGFDQRHGLVKVNPLAAWTDLDVRRYLAEHRVPVNPLVADGYPSIGCAPCTVRPVPGADPRSGRWAGSAKTECGVHT